MKSFRRQAVLFLGFEENGDVKEPLLFGDLVFHPGEGIKVRSAILDFLLLEKLFHQKKLREEMDKRFVKKIKSHFENEISRLRLDIKKVEDVIYAIEFLDLNL